MYLAIVPALAAFLLAIYLRYSSQGNAAFEAAMVTNGANITIPWFAIYQTTSGFTSDGMSPVDASMVPFNACGPFLFLLAFVVAAGNSCYPILYVFLLDRCDRSPRLCGLTFCSLRLILYALDGFRFNTKETKPCFTDGRWQKPSLQTAQHKRLYDSS